jgi:hypothetical protein
MACGDRLLIALRVEFGGSGHGPSRVLWLPTGISIILKKFLLGSLILVDGVNTVWLQQTSKSASSINKNRLSQCKRRQLAEVIGNGWITQRDFKRNPQDHTEHRMMHGGAHAVHNVSHSKKHVDLFHQMAAERVVKS